MDQYKEKGQLAGVILDMALKFPGGIAALWRLLARADYALFRAFVADSGDDALRAALDEAPEAHQRILAADDYHRFRTVATADNLAPLRALLISHDASLLDELLRADSFVALKRWLSADGFTALEQWFSADGVDALKHWLFEDDFARFREVAIASNGAALRAVLTAENYRLLKEYLAANGNAALKAVVFESDTDFFDTLVRAREGRPLAAALFSNDAKLLCDVCRLQGDDALAPLLQSDGQRIARALPAAVKDEFAGRLVRAGATPATDDFSGNPGALEAALASPRAEAVRALQRKWATLAGVVPKGDPAIEARYEEGLRAIQSPDHVRGRVLDAITEGDAVHLAGGTLQFPCRHSLWTLMHEILLNEDYFFQSDTDAPVIIDGGAHMGMAVYYFKTLFPNARITAFEPEPGLHAMLAANVARNNFQDVSVLPYALATERATATFHVSKDWSMAGSLSGYRSSLGEASETVTVECVPLSEYLDGPVDFLKLDIEGVEDEVLEEAAPKLGNVRHLFCEFHQGPGLAPGRLAKILSLLDAAGFEVQVGKSHNYQETSRFRPLTHFGGSASQIIWARRKQGIE